MRMLALLLVASLLPCQEKNPDRWEADIKKFEEEDRKDPPPQGEIVFIGSSSIRMWKLKESFPALKCINRGFGGSEMGDAARYADRIVTPYKPRIVVVFSGGNDIAKGKTPEQVLESFKALVKKIREPLPKTKILYLTLKATVKRWSMDKDMRRVNELVAEFAKTQEGIVVVDVDGPTRAADGSPRPDLLLDDGLHMNDAGYRIWNALLLPHLQP